MSVAGGVASAQSSFPSKPVHIFAPYAAGGVVDILARTHGDVMSRQWASPIGGSPAQFDAKIRADYRKWGPITEAAGMKAE